MKLKQAKKVIESNRVIYPECVNFIKDKIKHLKSQSKKRIHDNAYVSAKNKIEKAKEWQRILDLNLKQKTI
jgi:hypothetical protein